MPKSFVNYKQYKVENIGSIIRGKLYKERRSYEDLGNELDTTRQNVAYKLRKCSFKYEDLLTVFDFLNFSDEEILIVMKLRNN